MQRPKLISLTILFIILQISNGLLLEELSESGISGHTILIGRSLSALIISVVTAFFLQKNIVPKKITTQAARLVFSGTGLLLITQSYQYISASSVATFQRADIPIIALITIIAGKNKSTDKLLLILASALTIASIVLLSSSLDESPTGYYLALTGILLISISNFFVKKTAGQENFFVFVNTACISCIIIGFFVGMYQGFNTNFSLTQLLGLAVSGLCMFGIYFSLMEFYKSYSIEKAQYPAMLAAFLIMCGEMFIEHKLFSPLFILLNVLLLVIITATIRFKL